MPANAASKDQALRLLRWKHIEDAVVSMANWCKRTFSGAVVVYGIPRGGLIPAVMLAQKLESMGIQNRLVTDLDHIQPHELQRLLVVDDICDSGDTMAVIKRLFPDAKFATVFERAPGAPFKTDYHIYTLFEDFWLQFPWEDGKATEVLATWGVNPNDENQE